MNDFSPEMMEKLVRHFEALTQDVEEARKRASQFADECKKLKSAQQDLINNLNKLNKNTIQNTASMSGLFKEMVTGRKKFKDLSYDLDSLNNQIDSLTDQIEESTKVEGKAAEEATKLLLIRRAEASQAKVLLETTIQHNKQMKAATEGLSGLSSTITKGVLGAFTGAAKSALSGSDALTVATGFMTAGIDTANNASQAGSKALTEFGTGTMAATGKITKTGVAAVALGTAMSFLSSATSELAKAGIGFMMSQTQKLIQSFESMSASGAIYAGGMMEMIESSKNAGMTLEQMSKAVAANREQFAQSGLGVGEGSKKMAKAMEAGGKAARDGMFALGMNMEEQADAYAKTMAQMAGPSGQLKATDAEVAAQTQTYAQNLKLISDITGKDAKARAEKLRQDNDTLAFNSYLNSLDKDERFATIESMKLMTAEDQRYFREKKLYGNVVSQDLAIARAQNSGMRKAQDMMIAASEAHVLDVHKVGKAYEETSAEMVEQANKAGMGMGLARSGAAVEASKAMNASVQEAAKTGKAYAEAAGNIEKMAKPTGPDGKEKPEVTIAKVQQDFATAMQDIATTNLPAFAKAIDKTIADIKSSVESLANLGATAGTMPPWATALIGVGSSLLQMIPLLVMSKGMGGIGGGIGGGIMGGMGKAGGAVAKGGGKLMDGAIKIAKSGTVLSGGKILGKLIPGVGLVSGSYEAYEKYKKGDTSGAAIAMAGGLASLIPGVGGMVAAGISIAGAAHELKSGEAPAAGAKKETKAATEAKEASAQFEIANAKKFVADKKLEALKVETKAAEDKYKAAKDEYEKNKTDRNKEKLEQATRELVESKLNEDLASIIDDGATLGLKNAKIKLEDAKTAYAKLKVPAAPAIKGGPQTSSAAEDAAWGGGGGEAAPAAPAAPKAAGGIPAGRPGSPSWNLAAKAAAGGDTGALGEKTANPATAPKKAKGAGGGNGNMSDDEIKKMIIAHEGMRTKPYKDSLGLWTVGVGHLIGDGKTLPADWDREFSKEEVMALFDKDYAEHKRAAESKTPKFAAMTGAGQGAFTDLTFNMGPNWLSKWPKLKAQIEAEDTQGMASNLAGSTWAKQVKSRSNDIIALAEQAFPKLAKGGITDGTSIAGEKGPEAVVPLPDGRTIPVKMDVTELVKKMDEMIKTMREHLEQSDQTEKLDEMIRALKDQNYTSQKILQASA